MKSNRLFIILCVTFLLILIITYANHFNNAFHFDDSHTIVNNSYIRSLSNLTLFFTDGRTFSSLPANQMYRPLFTLLSAIDYRLAGGLNPFYFHLSSFFWFLTQLVCMFFMFLLIFNKTFKHDGNKWLALFGVGWYGLHTANAETVNYISARSDLISTMLVVAALLVYIAYPSLRKFYLYFIPFILGTLVKPTALMFAPILLIYILLFETEFSFKQIVRSILFTLPAFILAGLLFVLQNRMTPSTFYPSNIPLFNYLITQPFVMLYYFKIFFFPFGLSADYDWQALSNILNPQIFIGSVFVLIMIILVAYFSKEKKNRPISFGLLWFFIALLPSSSIFPLSEVLNDHRVFFPFVGLMLGVVWGGGLLLYKYEAKIREKSFLKALIVCASVFILLANALGTWHRNQIWKNEESLWQDVTLKSPKNGRGLMNYGITQMEKGNYAVALRYYEEALKYTPQYSLLYVNLGIVNGATGKSREAEDYFKKALLLDPGNYNAYCYYARWLNDQGRQSEAIPLLEKSIALSPGYIPARYILLNIYSAQHNRNKESEIANQLLSIDPNDTVALKIISPVKAAKKLIESNPSPENYINLSLAYYNEGLFKECISASEQALKLKPNYTEAYNNIGAAYNQMKRWDEAIKSLEKALSINPNFQLAKNNLAWAKSQKHR